jgi:hypothetical protein
LEDITSEKAILTFRRKSDKRREPLDFSLYVCLEKIRCIWQHFIRELPRQIIFGVNNFKAVSILRRVDLDREKVREREGMCEKWECNDYVVSSNGKRK